MSVLAHDFTLIAPDLFGHGESAKPLGDYSLAAHAGTLRDLMETLEIPSATIVGHSLGGGVAIAVRLPVPRAVRAAGAGQQRRAWSGAQPAAARTDVAGFGVAAAPR
jgi:pimeloyl-ACP methyl ester carboxylesterase